MSTIRHDSIYLTSLGLASLISMSGCLSLEFVPDEGSTTPFVTDSGEAGTDPTSGWGSTNEEDSTTEGWETADPSAGDNCNQDSEPAAAKNTMTTDGGEPPMDVGDGDAPYLFDSCHLQLAPTGVDDSLAEGTLKIDGEIYELGRASLGGLSVADEAGNVFDNGFTISLVPTEGCVPKVELAIIDMPTTPFEIDFASNEVCPGSFERNAMVTIALAEGCAVLEPVSTGSLVVSEQGDFPDAILVISANGIVTDEESTRPFELEVDVDMSTVDTFAFIHSGYYGDICES